MMKKKLPVYIISIVVLYLIQTSVFHYLRIFDVIPNLLLIYVSIMAYFRGSDEGIILGLSTGLFIDVMTGKVVGFYGLIFFLIALIIGSIPRKLFWDNMFIVLLFSALVSIPIEFLGYLAVKVFDYMGGGTEKLVIEPGLYILKRVIPEVFYRSLLFPLIYFLCSKTDKFFNKDVREFAE